MSLSSEPASLTIADGAPAGLGARLTRLVRTAATRLRFLFVFLAVFAVVGSWETIRGLCARLTAGPAPEAAISSDTEFFCPMDPGVLSDWPSKCPVCNMTLVKRKRGETAPLPDGVMARMQLTPYRLSLGGIQTVALDYAPLARTLELPGLVARSDRAGLQVVVDAFDRERAWLAPGQTADVIPVDVPGRPPVAGHIRELPSAPGAEDLTRAVVAVEGGPHVLHQGERVRVRVTCPVDRLEPFRSQPTAPPPLAPGEARQVFVCMEHSEILRDAPGRCPRDSLELMPRPLLDTQRVRWWCPMHPDVTAERPGARCQACGGMALVPRVVSYRPPGKVLALPGAAALDDGVRCLVYVERGPGMFDARAVVLGPRCGAWFPVVSGLEPGDRVVAQGAFLVDAETRLDAGLAFGYFGAGVRENQGPAPSQPHPGDDHADLSWARDLSNADRPAAVRQGTCPVTGKALGSMGTPAKLNVRGQDVFLCCDGCIGAIEANPEKYLAKLRSPDRKRPPPNGAEPRP